MVILGISAFYHDAAATIVEDGQIIAAAQEERFTRKKNDPDFPAHAIRFCLEEAGIKLSQVDSIVFYDKPLLKFERLLETYYAFAPVGIRSFIKSIPVWLNEKMFLKRTLRKELGKIGEYRPDKLRFSEHHLSHAASAFFPSGFERAAVLTIDGVGEWATTSICHGIANRIKVLKELRFPHSPGLLYSAFTYYLGFRVNSGEYKLMGLAPYGLDGKETDDFIRKIKEKMITIFADGSIWLDQRYFKYTTGLTMTNDAEWKKLFDLERRVPESDILQTHCNLAFAIQKVIEEIIIKMAQEAKKITGEKNLCLAGGVALNCVANGRLLNSGEFENIFVQPAAGDSGGSLGAALAVYHIEQNKPRTKTASPDLMKGSYLGPEVTEKEIYKLIRSTGAVGKKYDSFQKLCEEVARLINEGNIVGWVQGRMEFGPRALGNRSILGDPRDTDMQRKLNLKIKFRESFRPFAPAVIDRKVNEYFDLQTDSPYMLLVQQIKSDICHELPANYEGLNMKEKLATVRSSVPAVTHVDLSARIQTVHKEINSRFYQLIEAFEKLTGCGMLVNTSFNVRGEPIVSSANDAYNCFIKTDMDILVINDHLFVKADQPENNLIFKNWNPAQKNVRQTEI